MYLGRVPDAALEPVEESARLALEARARPDDRPATG
jgi:hypothetical protein